MSLLDVRTKIMLLFFANYLLISRAKSIYEIGLVLLLAILFILSEKKRKGFIYLAIFVILWGIDYYLLFSLSGKWLSFLSMLAVGGRLMLPCFMAGSYILSTTSLHEFMVGLRKWHVPESLLLVLAVMFRFLPTIPQDYQHIRQSLKLRGIFVRPIDIVKHPVQFFEYVMIPLLMSASRTAQDLTVASLTKSISSNPKKTSYRTYKMNWSDGLIWFSILISIIAIQLGVRST